MDDEKRSGLVYSALREAEAVEAVLKTGEIIINELDEIDKIERKKKKHIDRMFHKSQFKKK